MEIYAQRLNKGISGLDLDLDANTVDLLLKYHQMLVKWNKAYNLTAIRDPLEMVDRHLIDSLSVVPFVDEGKRLLDVGTGAGLPGMVLAMCYPNMSVTLLDSNGKKTRFLKQVVMELQLSNVEVVQMRLEECMVDDLFDYITSRAFATLQDMVEKSSQLLAENGQYIAMKGLYPLEEIAKLPQGFVADEVCELKIPFADGQRHLVKISYQENK